MSITVTDVNDNTPVFDKDLYIAELSSSAGIVEVHAEDPDEGANGLVIYEIVSGNTNGEHLPIFSWTYMIILIDCN